VGLSPGGGSLSALSGAIVGALKNPANAAAGNSGITLPSGFANANNIPTTTDGHIDYSQLPAPPQATPPPVLPQFTSSNDPNVADSLALEQQGLGQLDAALKSAREKAIIGFGDPSLANEAGFGLDPQAGAFAQQNYLSGNSTLSRLDKQHTLARQAVINQLASHGILNSGDLGYQEGNADQNYGNQVYDAKNSILDYLSNLLSSYNQNRTNLHQATIAARQNALNAFASNPDAYAQFFGG
jgi:hypothetical protein